MAPTDFALESPRSFKCHGIILLTPVHGKISMMYKFRSTDTNSKVNSAYLRQKNFQSRWSIVYLYNRKKKRGTLYVITMLHRCILRKDSRCFPYSRAHCRLPLTASLGTKLNVWRRTDVYLRRISFTLLRDNVIYLLTVVRTTCSISSCFWSLFIRQKLWYDSIPII